MKHYIALWATVLLLQAGCKPAAPFFFYNSSGKSLTLVLEIERGAFQQVPLFPKTSREVSGFWSIQIQHPKGTWRYEQESIPKDYINPEDRSVTYQIEEMGELYIVKPPERAPVKKHANQPPGFPLKPLP